MDTPKRSRSARFRPVLLLSLLLCLLLSACGDDGPVLLKSGQVRAMAADKTYYVVNGQWSQDGENSMFVYRIHARSDDRLVQTITVYGTDGALHVDDWQEITAHPGRFVSIRDLNADGKADLKILTDRRGEKPVYTAYLWDSTRKQFVESPYPSWPVRHLRAILIGGAAFLVAGGVILRRRKKARDGKSAEKDIGPKP